MAGDFGKGSIFGAVLLVVVSSYSAVVNNVKKWFIKLANYQLSNLAFNLVKTNGCQPQA